MGKNDLKFLRCLDLLHFLLIQVPIELIKRHHNFNIPTYWKGRNYITKENQNASTMTTEIKVPSNQLVPIPGGTVLLGKTHLESDYYGWDNEYGVERKELEEFEASQMLVSNAEYLEFVKAGG